MPDGTERMLVTLTEGARLASPEELLDVARAGARWVDVGVPSVLLVDMEQRVLQPFPGSATTSPQVIDATLAGRCYRLLETVDAGKENGRRRLFLPMLDGSERLGVIEVDVAEDIEDAHAVCGPLATLVAHFTVSKRMYGDAITRVRRRREMRLAAEIQWDLLPPLTLSTPSVTVSGLLEPCYEIGGDAFDYALNEPVMHLALLDAMGHGLDSSILSSVALGTYRHCRRRGDDLVETYSRMDEIVAHRFGPEAFATAQLAQFDRRDGRVRWINAGHPPPMLVRDGGVVGRLEQQPCMPVGYGSGPPTVGEAHLQPGDAVLWFTDGLVEARSVDGEFFGEDRLADLLERAIASGLPIPEIVRRLGHAVLEHQRGDLQDDATVLFLAWHPEGQEDAHEAADERARRGS